MELNKAIEILKEVQKNVIYEEIGTQELEAIDTVLNRLENLENRYLHLVIGGRTYQILNNIKKLQCIDLGNNEFTLEVLKKWN